MCVRLVWTRLALGDRRSIRNYIANDDKGVAIGLDERFSETAAMLAENPDIGRGGREPGTREFVVHQNYLLIYDVTRDTVRGLRVLDAARQWPQEET